MPSKFIPLFIKIMTILVGWGMTALVVGTWTRAALAPNHAVRVTVNDCNELWGELVLVPIVMIFVSYGSFRALRDLLRQHRGRGN